MCGQGGVQGRGFSCGGGLAWQEGGMHCRWGMHAREMATKASSSHPTGMHSCFVLEFLIPLFQLCNAPVSYFKI